jgi:hypothetical protein
MKQENLSKNVRGIVNSVSGVLGSTVRGEAPQNSGNMKDTLESYRRTKNMLKDLSNNVRAPVRIASVKHTRSEVSLERISDNNTLARKI